MEKTMILTRAVSGSGKTTLALMLEQYLPNAHAVAADDYWVMLGNGEYTFDIKLLGEAHKWCQAKVLMYMQDPDTQNIIVHNTNTSEKEIKPYIDMAEKYGYRIVSLIVEHRHDNENVHGVPEQILQKQEECLLSSIKLR